MYVINVWGAKGSLHKTRLIVDACEFVWRAREATGAPPPVSEQESSQSERKSRIGAVTWSALGRGEEGEADGWTPLNPKPAGEKNCLGYDTALFSSQRLFWPLLFLLSSPRIQQLHTWFKVGEACFLACSWHHILSKTTCFFSSRLGWRWVSSLSFSNLSVSRARRRPDFSPRSRPPSLTPLVRFVKTLCFVWLAFVCF